MRPRASYVVGFVFDRSREFVLLLRKTHPEWQAGKLNGVGGHVEPGESWRDAIRREGSEETGHETEWTAFAMLRGPDWDMMCFRARPDWMAGRVPEKNDVGEAFEVHPIIHVVHGERTEQVIPNLRWLIPLALADRVDNGCEVVHVR